MLNIHVLFNILLKFFKELFGKLNRSTYFSRTNPYFLSFCFYYGQLFDKGCPLSVCTEEFVHNLVG